MKNNTYYSPVAEPHILVNLAMFGNNHFNAFSERYHPKDQIPGGWPPATRLAFSESKMAAAYIRNMKNGITFLIFDVEC